MPPSDPIAAAYEQAASAFSNVAPFPARTHRETDTTDAPFTLIHFADIEPMLDTVDFVQGVLLEGSGVVTYGDSNAGKTFWTTDLALHVAAGMPWRNRRVEQGGVIYCVLEGGYSFANRVAAWKLQHGLDDREIPFAAIKASMNLLDPDADVHRLVASIRAAAGPFTMPVKLVVIDTLFRAMAGGNENAPEDMGALVASMDLIRAETGACVMFIHHSGKDAAKGARGHSSLKAAIDTEIEVVADEATGQKMATVIKQRDLKKGDCFEFTLKPFEVGQNRYGEPVTTCLVEVPAGEHADGHKASAPRRFKGHTQRALEVLIDLVAKEGQPGHRGVPQGLLSVPDRWWRERFYDRAMIDQNADAKKKAFTRASTELLNKHAVGFEAGRVWIISRHEKQPGHFSPQDLSRPIEADENPTNGTFPE